MKIYVASSWRNSLQPTVVDALRNAGHEVYDFRNPPNGTGFAWSEIDPDWQSWRAADYREKLRHPLAEEGFASDFDAMKWADCCVLVLPCGRSAHLELGWSVGAGKRTIIMTRDGEEPELMAKMADAICVSLDEVLASLVHFEAEAVCAEPMTADLTVFLRRRVARSSGDKIRSGALYESYIGWARLRGQHPLTVRSFSDEMREMGIEKQREGALIYYLGIRALLPDEWPAEGDVIIRKVNCDPVAAAVASLTDEQKARLLA